MPNNIKPIFIRFDTNIMPHQTQGIIEGINELLTLAEVLDKIDIFNYESWPLIEYADNIDKHITYTRRLSNRAGRLDAGMLMSGLYLEHRHNMPDHYGLIVLKDDFYLMDKDGREHASISDISYPHVAAAVTIGKYSEIIPVFQRELIKSNVMRSLGHLFGLFPSDHSGISRESDNACSEICIMRQGETIDKWIWHTLDRLKRGAFCKKCLSDLKIYFRQ